MTDIVDRYWHLRHECERCNDVFLEDADVSLCRACRWMDEHVAVCSCEHFLHEQLCKVGHVRKHFIARYLRCRRHGTARNCPAEISDDEIAIV